MFNRVCLVQTNRSVTTTREAKGEDATMSTVYVDVVEAAPRWSSVPQWRGVSLLLTGDVM